MGSGLRSSGETTRIRLSASLAGLKAGVDAVFFHANLWITADGAADLEEQMKNPVEPAV
jgi:hypothetical protein